MAGTMLLLGCGAGTTTVSTLNSGLVAFWKFTESAAQTRQDYTGSFPLSVNGSVGAPGGNTVSFPGAAGNYLSYASGGVITSGAFSIAMSVNISVNSPPYIFWCQGSGVTANQFLAYQSVGRAIQLVFGLNAGNTCTLSYTADGTWKYLVGTYDGTTATLYVNGVSVSSAVSVFGSAPVSMSMGASPDGSVNAMNGIVGATGIWNRVLTTDEITTLYNGGAGGILPPF